MGSINPEFLQTNKLNECQIRQWRENGYLLVDNLIEKDVLNNAILKLNEIFPEINNTDVINEISETQDFGSNGKLEFPCKYKEVNEITISNNIINCCEQLLGEEIRLLQSDAWSKYGGAKNNNKSFCLTNSNRDQRIHVDYGNNTLVHPSGWNTPDAVALIVYFDDSDITGGGTSIVPKNENTEEFYEFPIVNNPGLCGIPWINDKESAEKMIKEKYPEIYSFRQRLYENEKNIKFKPGTVLFYRHDIWHRGTPVNFGKVRRVINLAYRRESCDWLTNWNPGWAKNMYNTDFYVEKLISNCNVKQRNILGFPKPGHRYWNEMTLEAVKKRYESYGFDITPYQVVNKNKKGYITINDLDLKIQLKK